jgi:Tol biopolymer transport system component
MPRTPRRLRSAAFASSACGLAMTAMAIVPAASAGVAAAGPRDRIVFVWADFEFVEEELATVRADGSQYTMLTSEEGFDLSPEYSPDGRRIAFTSARSMPPGFPGEQRFYSELYVMDSDGSDARRLTFTEGVVDFQPSWSPDGQRIVVARGPGTTPPDGQLTAPTDLWIIDLASGRNHQLTNSPETWEGFADWSPDGRRIAFEGDPSEPGNSDVYTIRADGGGLRRLTSQPGFDGDAHYSPDGRTVVFDSDRNGNLDVFVTRDTEAPPLRQLTDDRGDDVAGGYSADGRFIAFSSPRDSTFGIPDVFRMRADGTQETNLTRTPTVFEFDPNWQP